MAFNIYESNIGESILIIIVIIFIYILYKINKNKLTLVESNDNGIKVMVYNDNKKTTAADLLAEMIKRMFTLRNYLEKNKESYSEYLEYIDLLVLNFKEEKTSIYENDPNSDLTSFSVNKGDELAFCLRSKKDKSFHPINLLMYVALHELAHIACPEIGHGELFKKVFRFLAKVAIDINIYIKQDYGEQPVEYCGMVLSSSII
jgi:predicted metal-dependent hydrolase